MEKSAGIALIHNKRILLTHPTNTVWSGTWSIPKGQVEDGENPMDTAIRETYEEIGLTITQDMLNEGGTVTYRRKNGGKAYKKVFYFVCRVEDLSLFGYNDNTKYLDRGNLQLDEVDKAGFFDYTDASELLHWRQKEIIETLLTK